MKVWHGYLFPIPIQVGRFGKGCLGPSNFADHDSIGPETESMAQQASQSYLTGAFGVGWPGFEPDDMATEPELRGVLDRDGALRPADLLREDVQQCRLPCSGAPGDQQVHSVRHGSTEELGSVDRDPAHFNESIKVRHRFGEAAYRDDRSVDRCGRNHRVEPRAVRQSSIDRRT